MKKIFMLATAAFLVSGVAFSHDKAKAEKAKKRVATKAADVAKTNQNPALLKCNCFNEKIGPPANAGGFFLCIR